MVEETLGGFLTSQCDPRIQTLSDRIDRLKAALKEIAQNDGSWQGAEDAYRFIKIACRALDE